MGVRAKYNVYKGPSCILNWSVDSIPKCFRLWGKCQVQDKQGLRSGNKSRATNFVGRMAISTQDRIIPQDHSETPWCSTKSTAPTHSTGIHPSEWGWWLFWYKWPCYLTETAREYLELQRNSVFSYFLSLGVANLLLFKIQITFLIGKTDLRSTTHK